MGLLEDDEKVAANTELAKTADVEAVHSERIFLTQFFNKYGILCLVKDGVKPASNASLGESVDAEVVLALDPEDNELAATG